MKNLVLLVAYLAACLVASNAGTLYFKSEGEGGDTWKDQTVDLGRVVCPDGGYCDDGQTCCKMSAGVYGCCPEPQAVCCSDGQHCCPHGTTCDVAAGACLKSNGLLVPVLKKTPAL